MSYYALLAVLDAYRDKVVASFAPHFPFFGIPVAVPTFLFDFLYYLLPPTLLTALPLWILKKHFPKAWKPTWFYYALAAFAAYVYIPYYYNSIIKLRTDPTFSLAFDLWGANSRSMTFLDLCVINLACILHIGLYSGAYGIPMWQAAIYMFLSLIGVGHSLWMARIVDDGTKKTLPRPSFSTYKIWFFYGLISFCLWINIVVKYFIEWGNLNIFRNGGGPGLTPGANFAVLAVLWGTLEFVPYYTMQNTTFLGAYIEILLDYAFVGAYFARQLYLRNRYADDELFEAGIQLDWAAERKAPRTARAASARREATPTRVNPPRAAASPAGSSPAIRRRSRSRAGSVNGKI